MSTEDLIDEGVTSKAIVSSQSFLGQIVQAVEVVRLHGAVRLVLWAGKVEDFKNGGLATSQLFHSYTVE